MLPEVFEHFRIFPFNLHDIHFQIKNIEKPSSQESQNLYVSLRLRVQNGISRLISALCVNCLISIPHTMRKLSDLYSGIFQNY